MSLAEQFEKIKQPKLQSQHQTALIVSAVEDTLRDQHAEFTPTAYFAALLALLSQSVGSKGTINKDLATSVVYLLDLTAPHVPPALLRSKFSQILTNLVPVLTSSEAEAPLLRPSIGCLGTLLIAQDNAAWALPHTQISPRRALAGLLSLAADHRPKVRKRAQEAIVTVLKSPPPSPSLDHPAADMCAETALRGLASKAAATAKGTENRHQQDGLHESGLIHSLHLVKIIATASGGWPSRNIETLCEVLMNISRSSNEFLTIGALEVFETIFTGMADERSSAKLPRLMGAISELKPAQNDSQLLPPWIAVISRGYDVSFQVNPQDTFEKLPEVFELISTFMASPSHNIRISASECLISFMANCIPNEVILEPSIYDEKTLERLAECALSLLAVKYQSAWIEVFKVFVAMFEALKWRSYPLLSGAVATIGELRGSQAFQGKKEADEVLGEAIMAMGPKEFLSILPLNAAKQRPGQQGRPWLLPLLRDHISNTNLGHFRSEFVPLSEKMYQKVLNFGSSEKTMEIKIFETLVHQIWSLLPGYCDLPLDVPQNFDQAFAEMVSNLLYKQTDLRVELCKALQNLVDTNRAILDIDSDKEDMIVQRRVSKADAQKNINHLAGYAGNLLAVLFNVYSETLPHYRGYILKCINSYLAIIPEKELLETFTRIATLLEAAMPSEGSQTQADKQKQEGANKIPPASHTLMDLIITMSIYLPHSSLSTLFNMAALALSTKSNDPQLQKKAYKLIPRLAESTIGQQALRERNPELQQLFLATAEKTPAAVRHDRLQALSQLVAFLPASDLHFIPSVLSEVVMACKETNEKARTAAFDLLVQMARTIEGAPEGTTVRTSLVPHMPSDSALTPATISEFFTMVSAGLAGSTPHMVSASITALARLTFEFQSQLPKEVLADVVQTIDLFLTSNNREIVRSVLGFVKVAVTSLSADLILLRLENLIPSLMVWSHEHSGRLRAKVKNILERMIRKFGFAEIEKWTPEADRKLVVHIRKEREKRKRKKAEAQGETDISQSRRNKFENEFDEALHSSSSEDFASDSDDAVSSKKERGKQQRQYIRERESSPLDLLAPSALANISSTKPVKFRDPKTPKAKTDPDGKLILRGDDDDAADDEDVIMEGDSNMRAEGGAGVNSYLEAVSGPDAVRKGQRGKLKASSGMKKADRKTAKEFDVDEDMEEEIVEGVKKARKEKMKGLERRSDGKVAKGKFGAQRRGLGQGKMSRGGGGGGGGGGHAGGRKIASGGTKFKGSGIRRR